MTALLTEQELAFDLATRCSERGEQGRLARRLGVTQSEISGVIHGHRGVRPGLAAAMGYRQVVLYEPVALAMAERT